MIVVFLAVGFLTRLEGLFIWHQNKDLLFLGDQTRPVMIDADSYYYMDLARDLLEGAYDRSDPHRCFPQLARRPLVPPLLSVLLAGLKIIFPFPLEYIAALIPCVLGLLLIFPVYAIGRLISGRPCGLIAAAVALFFPAYTARTVFGRFDTDCLNVFFATGAVYIALRFAAQTNLHKQLAWFCGWLILYLLFLWWWQQVPLEVSAIMIFPLALAAFFFGPSAKKAAMPVLIVGMIVLFWFIMAVGGYFDMDKIVIRMMHIFKVSGDKAFPTPGLFFGDQRADFVTAWSYLGLGGVSALILGLTGLAWLAVNQPRPVLAVLPLIAVSSLAFFGQRFLFFAAPLVGLGTGYAFCRLWEAGKSRFFMKVLLIGMTGIMILLCLLKIHQNNLRQPWLTSWHYAAMEKIGRVTEADAVIWSSFSKGYPLQFYARRATITDGSFHGGRLLYIQNRPLAVDDFRLAANWMIFYAAHGLAGFERAFGLFGRNWPEALSGLERLLAAGPEEAKKILQDEKRPDGKSRDEILRFVFPLQRHPLYLFIDIRQFQESWYEAGAWDMKRGAPPSLMLRQYHHLRQEPSGCIVGTYPYDLDIIRIDPQTGYFDSIRGGGKLTNLLSHNPGGTTVRAFPHQRGYYFEMIPEAGFGVLADWKIAETVFNRLMTRLQYDSRYFTPKFIEAARCQVWRVRGDVYE